MGASFFSQVEPAAKPTGVFPVMADLREAQFEPPRATMPRRVIGRGQLWLASLAIVTAATQVIEMPATTPVIAEGGTPIPMTQSAVRRSTVRVPKRVDSAEVDRNLVVKSPITKVLAFPRTIASIRRAGPRFYDGGSRDLEGRSDD